MANAQQDQDEKKSAKKKYALIALVLGVFFLFYIGDTLFSDWLKSYGVIELIENDDYCDEAVFSCSEKALVLATREVQATEKKRSQIRYDFYLTTFTSRALIKVDYRAKINYAILPEPWEVEIDEKNNLVRLFVSPIFAQNIDVDYGSVVGSIDGGVLVRNESWVLNVMMRNLSRKALINASMPAAIEEVRALIRETVARMVQSRYGTKKVEVIFKDEIKMKNEEEK